jgi:hypothetical protein
MKVTFVKLKSESVSYSGDAIVLCLTEQLYNKYVIYRQRMMLKLKGKA